MSVHSFILRKKPHQCQKPERIERTIPEDSIHWIDIVLSSTRKFGGH